MRKFPLFAGISPNVKFLRFPEIVVVRRGEVGFDAGDEVELFVEEDRA